MYENTLGVTDGVGVCVGVFVGVGVLLLVGVGVGVGQTPPEQFPLRVATASLEKSELI